MSWSIVELGDLAEFRNGINYNQNNFGSGIKVVGVVNFQNYIKPRYNELEEVNPEGVVKEEDILQNNDILFVRSNGNKDLIGRSLFIESPPEPITFSGFCIRTRFTSNQAFPRFFAYLFRSDLIRKTLSAYGGGTNIANLNQKILSRLQVPLPPLPTQQRIAEILSTYDRLIDNNNRRIALLEESIHQLYKEWFVRSRFPGYESVKVVNGIPDGWSRVEFGEALILQRGFDLPSKNRKSGDVPVYASTGINGFHDTPKVKAPGVVTGRSGTVGSVMYVQKHFWPLNTTLWVKEFKKVTPPFAYCLLSQMDLNSYQAGAAVPTLNRNVIHEVKILLPSEQLQRKFDNFANSILIQIEILKKYNYNLRQARDLLLPPLMNGSIAV
ncbi:MAG: restriction endonuclease subunit S [Nostoc sp.]|uniref:restriction endonuclease subunit S n=1 Tax=Nostoc sp. TaxID=1180 RepID=UPI002FF7684B